MKKNNRKGFTIVELVIVIAVIAILAGVLIPTFSGIVNKAKLNAALQEAKTIMTNYTASIDYSETVPAENYYIAVVADTKDTDDKDDDLYYVFKVTDGVIEPKPVQEDVTKGNIETDLIRIFADDTLAGEDATDTDDWPDVETNSAN